MIRHNNLFEQIISFENLYSASRKARKGKRVRANVMEFEADIEAELLSLREELKTGTYQPGKYREFTIYERKHRRISAAPYRDRVVHHALCSVIEPLFEPAFIHDSYACRKGKGTHRAVERFTQFSRRCLYVLKVDIKQYFPSIDHDILLRKVRRKIKCPETLRLIELIIRGSNIQDPANAYFHEDNLFTPYERRRGIPIGNLTSQFFANLYLNEFDHYVKEQLRCRHYLRYVDDIAVFADEKDALWKIKNLLSDYLQRERLLLHPGKIHVLPVSKGVDYLGYQVFPGHRLVRKDTTMRFIKKLRKMRKLYNGSKMTWTDINSSVQAWLGHVLHADSYGLRKAVFDEISFNRQN